MDYEVMAAVKCLAQGEKAVLATIVATSGSTPRKAGAQVLFYPDGRLCGTIGGGCGEAEVRLHAFDVISSGEAALLKVKMNRESAEENGMICGGTMEVFLEPVCG
ncbi:MAG TPA: XdhC family protein [Verrucomicrobiae bacterium]|nr:XdhC family protein [Verrucomicrobiae bacterium]